MEAERAVLSLALFLVDGDYGQRMIANILVRMLSVPGGTSIELHPDNNVMCMSIEDDSWVEHPDRFLTD